MKAQLRLDGEVDELRRVLDRDPLRAAVRAYTEELRQVIKYGVDMEAQSHAIKWRDRLAAVLEEAGVDVWEE